jgi:hypothetical protein
MCLPAKPDQPSASSSQTRPIIGLGALVLLACLGGPAIAGALGALGLGVLVGATGIVFAIGLCVAVPAATLAWRRRSRRRASQWAPKSAVTRSEGVAGSSPAARGGA